MRALHSSRIGSKTGPSAARKSKSLDATCVQPGSMRLRATELLLAIAIALLGCHASGTIIAPAHAAENNTGQPSTAAASDIELTPYDAGYAFEASTTCPGLTMLATVAAEAKASDQFKRGQDMFNRYVELQKLEGACKAALNLYNDKTGKTAKVLHAK